jgi:two-component system osmolarity sensor histidine kinase EnvZ
MKFFPDTLAARTVVLVVAVVAIAEIATLSLFFHQRSAAHRQQTTQFIAGQVKLLQTVLPGLDAEARRRLAANDVGEPGLKLRTDAEGVPEREPRFGFAQRLSQDLEALVGGPVTLRHSGRGRRDGLWIGFTAGGERWWLVLPPPRFEAQALPMDLWFGLAAALAALVLVAALFVRSINGPLARLGAAVAATGERGASSPQRVALEGPSEVRALAERHNTMLAQLAAADAERRTMLAGLTHDLRAPLARLRVRLALLERESERAGLARDADDMERIIGQCLAFLRNAEVSASPHPAQPARLALADAVSIEVARQNELGRPIAMSVSAEAAGCEVALTRGELQRILDNLIDNALQYGAPPLAVALAVEAEQAVTLRFRDQGKGIAERDRENALEAFVQIDPARATGGSCGLGLAIVRGIVMNCGGRIRLTEAVGGGLEVVIDFPALAVADRV